ncbi:Site-specific recombinase XerD [Sporobacter termitidis DSM 10068]|uniref:Site-specific recombinase XerD n=1 Tax=Sporobacter termitidis DSM 10068 TaxID=1123282 RepID=A0A1M5ZKS6_9FIRM|nr:site-specific integrase [Sporobacter termitidis]SHI24748.1 Site-specific recombinase XerD [Sporobacter termitidis DSM 10068]
MVTRKNRRTANGSGSIVKRSKMVKGKVYEWWEGRYCVGTNNGTGKIRRPTITGKTQEEVAEKLRAVTAAIDAGTYTEPSKMPLKKWADIWLEDYTSDLKYLTKKTYKSQIENHIKPGMGAVKLGELTKHLVQSFINDLTRKKDLAPKTVKNIHGVLSAVLDTAVELDYIRVNPCAGAKLPRAPKTEVKPLTDEQINDLMKLIDADEYCGPMLKLILFTGLRVSEAIGLTWNCINYKTGTIRIEKQLQERPKKDGGYIFDTTKSDKPRMLTPAPAVMELLKQQGIKQLEAKNKALDQWQGWKDEKERKTSLVFTNEYGQHLRPNIAWRHLKKLAAQVGAPEACVHDLRHTYAVLSLQNGDDVKTLQENLGHATAAFTLDRYGHVSEKMKEDSAARMQKYIEQIKKAE